MKNIFILVSSLSLMACSSLPAPSGSKNLSQQTPSSASGNTVKVASIDGSYTGEIRGDYKNSKFANLKIGMSKRQVEDMVGMPSDQKNYQTGKAWIPVAGMFSQDQYRLETYYKNAGRLVYAKNGTKLYRIEVDKTEDGYQ
ncbi:hypothetical protein [Acinetobacter sp. YH12201]|uniref:hypothetical protein n=1 Tax=Acinetobacter sp. YH12201 TaxID=2601140 RepID=UPI0015D0E01D|nr:hypothetical protein [Acinetobacter sp. YH12201]